ncbi:geranylgeranylglyceryl/heptaprenylglyceryl phosphate synthase [bacterium]|nr:geranylgeranylglyceryl/heptaprenylglyceryl phosphate synthase [bacterium]
MNFWENVLERIRKGKKLHFTLVDPVKQGGIEVDEIAKTAQRAGSDAVMVGGSTVRDRKDVYRTIEVIKNSVSLPVILFPNSAAGISRNADYIFFMMLMNSRDIRFVVQEQIKGALLIKKWNIKPISVAYIIISTSRRLTMVEKIARVKKIRNEDTRKVVSCALAGQYFGMQSIYLEAGSGAKRPVSSKIISAVRKETELPLIVGGGIRSPETAKEKLTAGADIIVTGTIGEKDPEMLKKIIWAVKYFKQ